MRRFDFGDHPAHLQPDMEEFLQWPNPKTLARALAGQSWQVLDLDWNLYLDALHCAHEEVIRQKTARLNPA